MLFLVLEANYFEKISLILIFSLVNPNAPGLTVTLIKAAVVTFLVAAYHRPAVAQPCVNGDRLSKGRMAKFDPAQIRNPSTDRHKI